jgi:SPW repeat
MRFIPTRFHAPLDYIVGAALIAAPWIFQFSEHSAATIIPIVLGIGLIAYSLFRNYELGVWKVAPMAVHNCSTSLRERSWRYLRGCSASPTSPRTSGSRTSW